MHIRILSESHPGKSRLQNEDSILVDPDLGLLIVCDGVGGHAAGKQASETAATEIHKFLKEKKSVLQNYRAQKTAETRAAVLILIEQAIGQASRTIYSVGEVDPTRRGLATTVEVCWIVDDRAFLGHVGDSRIYLVRAGKTSLLTEDHTVVNEMVKQGIWKLEEGLKSPYAHTLTRAVGTHPFVQVDTLEVELVSQDYFILCSDGLANYIKGPDLLTLCQAGAFEQTATRMIEHALEGGGRDNVSVIVARVEGAITPAQAGVDAIQKEEVLARIPLFRYLSPRELTRVLALTSSKIYPKGSPILEEGQPGTQILAIVSGKADVSKGGQILATRGPGELLGEMAILDNSPRSASVVASESTTCLMIPQKDLFELLRRDSQLAVKVLWSLAQNLNSALRSTSQALASAKSDLESLQEGPFLDPSS